MFVVRKVNNNLFDVFNQEAEGWENHSRVAIYRGRQARVIQGFRLPEDALQNLVENYINPLLGAEREYMQLLDRIQAQYKRWLRDNIKYPYKDLYVTGQES